MIAAAMEPLMERKMSQFRDGSLKRKLGIPSIRKAGFCFGGAFGASYLGAAGAIGAPSDEVDGVDIVVRPRPSLWLKATTQKRLVMGYHPHMPLILGHVHVLVRAVACQQKNSKLGKH